MSKTDTNENQKKLDFLSEKRLKEILNILFPWGYSHFGTQYTGVSPYIEGAKNIISIIANDLDWDGRGTIFTICMDVLDSESDEINMYGFYVGIMKMIAPELITVNSEFTKELDALEFTKEESFTQHNRFPVKVIYEAFQENKEKQFSLI